MKLLSLNLGQPREILYQGRPVMTAIFKQPVEGRIAVRVLGLEGDTQADQNAHGGLDQAVYAYPHEHYSTWQEELECEPFAPGHFGENLTVSGLLENELQIGDILEIGSTTFQISQPRVPCFKLGVRMGDSSFLKRFTHSLRTGFYLRVLTEGTLAAGDPIRHTRCASPSLSVSEVFRLRHVDRSDRQLVQKATQLSALSQPWREALRAIGESS